MKKNFETIPTVQWKANEFLILTNFIEHASQLNIIIFVLYIYIFGKVQY